MNGRIYDPLLGRFLSADILVSNPAKLQSYNRYTYVGNNPLSTNDPSGYETDAEKADREKREKEDADRQAHNRAIERWFSGGGAPVRSSSASSDSASGGAAKAQTTSTANTKRTDATAIIPVKTSFGTFPGPTVEQYKNAWRKALSIVYPNRVARKLFNNYIDGKGTSVNLSEDEMRDVGARINLADSPEISAAIISVKYGSGDKTGIHINFHITPAGASANGTLGHFTVFGEGTVRMSASSETPGWYFSGTMSFYDVWDFDKADRKADAEARVTFARETMPGKAFTVTSDKVTVQQWASDPEASWSGSGQSERAQSENSWLSGIRPQQ